MAALLQDRTSTISRKSEPAHMYCETTFPATSLLAEAGGEASHGFPTPTKTAAACMSVAALTQRRGVDKLRRTASRYLSTEIP